MRIIRTLILLTAVAVFMPSPPEERFGAATEADPPATQILVAAVSTVADMRDFCARQAVVCDTAHYVAVKLEGKAKYGIELLYEWANESSGATLPQQAEQDGFPASGGMTTASGETVGPSQNTLELEDLIPEWRAPANQG
ncbi:MAG TPA: DUF5330 domain-containing protein [Nordella sp.]|nr:DUF5330 domain-containing protein [Nordella sp.]